MKTTRQIYCQYLLSSQINYTCTNLAEHLDGLDHNSVYRYLKREKLTPRLVWEKANQTLVATPNGYLIFDDTVVDKSYSFEIEGVRRQYSGNAHGVIKGIGIVNLVYYNAEADRYWIIDYRIFDPERDGKTKLDHVNDMLDSVERRGLRFGTVLMDAWYAAKELMLHIERAGKIYYCPLKDNRQVDEGDGLPKPAYRRVDSLEWTQAEIESGKNVHVKDFPKGHRLQLFRLVVSKDRTDYVVTNDLTQSSTNQTPKV